MSLQIKGLFFSSKDHRQTACNLIYEEYVGGSMGGSPTFDGGKYERTGKESLRGLEGHSSRGRFFKVGIDHAGLNFELASRMSVEWEAFRT